MSRFAVSRSCSSVKIIHSWFPELVIVMSSRSPSVEPAAKRARTRSPQAERGYDGEAELVRIKKRLIKVKQIRERGTSFGADETQGDEIDKSVDKPSASSGDPAGSGNQSTSRARTRSSSPEFRILGSSSRIQPLSTEPTIETSPEAAPQPITSLRSPPPFASRSIIPATIPRSTLAPRRSQHPPLASCRSVYSYTRLNHIEEGTYGIVFRARCNETGGIYALKKLKLEEEKQGFPITSLREVMALMVAGGHENVVGVREIVVGDTLNQ